MRVRGRVWLIVWLGFFLGVLVVVAGRQSSSIVIAAELRAVQENRRVLESQRNELLMRLRQGQSRATLIPKANALGLRLPVDSEVVTLEGRDP